MSYKKSVFRSLAMVTQLGFSVITPIFLCIFAGYQIDSRFGTKLIVPLLILGTLAGVRSAWLLISRILKADREDDERMKQERQTTRSGPEFSKPKEPSRIYPAGTKKDEEKDSDGMAN